MTPTLRSLRSRPLHGRRVLVTRPLAQSPELANELVERGAIPVLLPTIHIRPAEDLSPLDRALSALADYAWITFTSANSVDIFFDRLGAETVPDGVRIAAVGTATARAVAARGAAVDFVPSEFLGEQLGRELEPVHGNRVLFPKAARAREALATELGRRGALVDEIAVYETLPAAPDPVGLAQLEQGIDAATFTSASTVENYFVLLGARAVPLLDGAVVACIGPVTSEAARAKGLPVHVEPASHTVPDLVIALEQHFAAAALAESQS